MSGRSRKPKSSRLDGNAAAGLLSQVFASDVTTARATCVNCGSTDKIGALLLYAQQMGAVLRCPGCNSVVLRVARTPTQLWLDATGSKCIVMAVQPAGAPS